MSAHLYPVRPNFKLPDSSMLPSAHLLQLVPARVKVALDRLNGLVWHSVCALAEIEATEARVTHRSFPEAAREPLARVPRNVQSYSVLRSTNGHVWVGGVRHRGARRPREFVSRKWDLVRRRACEHRGVRERVKAHDALDALELARVLSPKHGEPLALARALARLPPRRVLGRGRSLGRGSLNRDLGGSRREREQCRSGGRQN